MSYFILFNQITLIIKIIIRITSPKSHINRNAKINKYKKQKIKIKIKIINYNNRKVHRSTQTTHLASFICIDNPKKRKYMGEPSQLNLFPLLQTYFFLQYTNSRHTPCFFLGSCKQSFFFSRFLLLFHRKLQSVWRWVYCRIFSKKIHDLGYLHACPWMSRWSLGGSNPWFGSRCFWVHFRMAWHCLNSSCPVPSDSSVGCDEQGLREHLRIRCSWVADRCSQNEVPSQPQKDAQTSWKKLGRLSWSCALWSGCVGAGAAAGGTLAHPPHRTRAHSTKNHKQKGVFHQIPQL